MHKSISEKIFVWSMIFSLVFWSFGSPINFFIPGARANGGVTPNYLPETEGMDIMITSTSTIYAVGEFNIFDSSSGSLNSLTVTLKDVPETTGFDPNVDLSALSSTAVSSGMSLWEDDGDGHFSIASDTPAGNISLNWTNTASGWQASFSSINWSYPASINKKVYIAFRAANISTSSPKGFETIIETGGMVFTGGSISNWPDDNHYFPPVWIGAAGAGGFGSPVLISEIQTAGASTTDEFIELYNRSPMAVNLGGWRVKYASGTASGILPWMTIYSFSTSSPPSIEPGGYYLLGHGSLSTSTDAGLPADSLSEISGYVGLFDGQGGIMDWVGYGSLTDAALAEGGQATYAPAASSSIERKAFHDSIYTMMIAGGIDQFMGNGEDSNNNAMDFIIRPTSEPQSSNAVAEVPQGGPSGGSPVLVNEIYYRPSTAGLGWIEVFNRSDTTQNIGNFVLKHKNWSYTFPVGIDIPANNYLLVKWNQGVSGATGTENGYNYIETGSLGMDLDTYGGDIILLDNLSNIMDYVEFGGTNYANEANATGHQEWMAGDYVPHCLTGQSIGRRSTDGEDWNNAGDWQTFASPSPGTPNMGGDSTAPTTVTNVTLADNDSVEYGIDGRDISIAWTPSTTQDPSFDRYEIFLLPQGTQIDFMSHKPIDSIYGGQYQYDASGTPSSVFSYTGGEFITKDSAGTLLSDGNYVAYILAFDSYGNKSGTAQSVPTALSNEIYAAANDHSLPFIMHMGVWNAAAGSDLHLIARADDDRMLSSTTPLRVVWKAGTDFSFNLNTGATTDNCFLIQANFYDCVISWSGVWNENTVIGYYLKALDDAGNQSFMSASLDADISGSEATVADHPFYIDIMPVPSDAGTEADLFGSTYSWDGNILASTTVFFEGLAIAPAMSNASGTFAFADNILDYGMYRVMAVKEGYMNMSNDVYRGDSVSFYLNEGNMNMTGGGGDAGGNPIVTWTAPFDNMMGAPIDIFCTGDCSLVEPSETPIVIAFDRPMNDSTINDQNAADFASNIYLTTTGADRVGGKVYYDSDSNEARFYATNHNTLTLGTYYNIVVTQAVTDELGNPVMGFNPDGSYSSAFTTIISTTTDYSDFATGGASMPPYVMGVTPAPGSFNIPRSTSAVIEFSEPMDPAKINNSTIKLVPITDSESWTEGSAIAATVSLDQATRKIATINPSSDLNANYDWWVVKVMGDAKSSSGMYMADPNSVGGCADWTVCSELNAVTAHESSFQINTGGVDTTKPTVTGTYPNNNDGITSSGTAVNVGIGALEIGFSEAMDPGTINAQNIKLRAGSSLSGGKVNYDPASNNAKFMPASALLANTQYTLRISADCLDLSGNQLNATTSVYFKTGAADTAAPEVMYANGDDYSIALTFNEPMNAAKRTNTENWPYSVLNPANYAVNGLTPDMGCANSGSWSCNPTIIGPYNGATGTPLTGLGLSFSYEDYNNTVIIKGFSFDPSTTDFQIFVDNVRDRSNNEVADSGKRAADNSHLNAARAPLHDSADTYGALGPGAVDNNMDMGDMGMMMAGAFPMNAMAGQNSTYFIDIPTTKSIPIGGKIIITFPVGFDISSAVKDPYSSVNNDINEQNAGKVTIDSVASDQSARTITIIATTSATQAVDYLHMDIKGIVNSNIPKDFGTEGYRTDIKTFTADGALLETINTMPFFITEAGNLTISGNISGLSSGDSGTMSVYLGSPMTGPMEAEISIDEANSPDGTYSFTNLPDGEYYIFTDPTITINGNDYFGNPHSEPIWLNGASSSKNITLQPAATAGAAVTVSLTGDFTTDGVADDVDVFAGSPSSFRVKKLSGLGNVNGATTTLYLSQGDWMIGIGPTVPENVSGPPPMTDWMPPMNVYYYSDGSTSGNVNFNISGQSTTTVSGTVVDGSGTGIADAEVYAYQPMGGYGGSFTKTATDGSFTLKIPVLGTYMIGAHKPGLPEPKEKYVDVSANVSGLTIKITKPAYTISGKVLNSSGNAIAYASVWTWQESGWGHADTMSDASGNYILYVNAGTWHVEADAPGIGWMEHGLPVTTNATNTTDINISPSSDTDFYTISGEVGISTDSTYSVINTPFANMPIRAVQYSSTTGAYLGKEFNAMTNSNGEYTITVPAGAYRVDIWTQEYGELGVNNQAPLNNTLNQAGIDDKYANNPANVDVFNGNVTDANIVVAQTGLRNVYITVNNAPASQEGYLNIEGVNFSGGYAEPNGFNMFRRIDDLNATTTIRLADGDYFMFLDVSGYGSYIPDKSDRDISKDDIDISGTSTVHFTMPDRSSGMVTITGTIYSGSESGGNELADAWVWISNPNNGYHNGTESESNGTYSLVIPTGSGYKLGADKPGFMSEEPTSLDGSASSMGNNIVLTPQGSTISGYIYADENSNSAYDSGEGVPNGFVRAETTECSDSDTSNDSSCIRSHAPVDGTGAYEIGVVNGTWKVYGMADGYAETEYGTNITISGSSASGKNIELTVDSNWTTKSKKKSITPASGGSLDDTDPDGTGIKLTIPPNALGNSNSSGDVNAQKTSSVTKTNSSDPVGGEGVTITATDNSGQAITNLDDYIDVEMVLYKAEVDAAIADGELTYAKLKNTKNAYWDSTANDWVNLATTRKAYYKENSSDTEWTLYASSTSDTPAFENFINQVASSSITVYDYKLVYVSKTNHLTVFAVIMPFVAVPAQASPPANPNPVTPTGGGGSYINYCTSVEYGAWSDCIDGVQTRVAGTTTPASCKLTSAQEALLQRECVVGEKDKTEENIVSPEITPVLFKTIDQLYFEQGKFIVRADVDEILPALGIVVRNHEGESLSRRTLTDRLGIKLGDYEPRLQYALTNFITYGSPDTYKLGWGERAGVLNSFMAAFGKVPQTAEDWSDVIKIANGRWPQERSEQAENMATEHFRKIYLRNPDRNNPHDDAAVTVIAYGLRPANRNMDSEAAAIRIFKAIYDDVPRGATDWDVVRAIAYSGAVR